MEAHYPGSELVALTVKAGNNTSDAGPGEGELFVLDPAVETEDLPLGPDAKAEETHEYSQLEDQLADGDWPSENESGGADPLDGVAQAEEAPEVEAAGAEQEVDSSPEGGHGPETGSGSGQGDADGPLGEGLETPESGDADDQDLSQVLQKLAGRGGRGGDAGDGGRNPWLDADQQADNGGNDDGDWTSPPPEEPSSDDVFGGDEKEETAEDVADLDEPGAIDGDILGDPGNVFDGVDQS